MGVTIWWNPHNLRYMPRAIDHALFLACNCKLFVRLGQGLTSSWLLLSLTQHGYSEHSFPVELSHSGTNRSFRTTIMTTLCHHRPLVTRQQVWRVSMIIRTWTQMMSLWTGGRPPLGLAMPRRLLLVDPRYSLRKVVRRVLIQGCSFLSIQVTVLTLFLTSPTLPQGKTLSLDITNPTALASLKKNPLTIKEGVEYKFRALWLFSSQSGRSDVFSFSVGITFKVNHSIITGVRYIQVVKRSGVKGHSLLDVPWPSAHVAF